jgi:hypothetical protein
MLHAAPTHHHHSPSIITMETHQNLKLISIVIQPSAVRSVTGQPPSLLKKWLLHLDMATITALLKYAHAEGSSSSSPALYLPQHSTNISNEEYRILTYNEIWDTVDRHVVFLIEQ